MTENKRRRVHMADPLIAHLVRARTTALGAGFPRTAHLIEQALCSVLLEYHGEDRPDPEKADPRAT